MGPKLEKRSKNAIEASSNKTSYSKKINGEMCVERIRGEIQTDGRTFALAKIY